jgi:hypothetical protein
MILQLTFGFPQGRIRFVDRSHHNIERPGEIPDFVVRGCLKVMRIVAGAGDVTGGFFEVSQGLDHESAQTQQGEASRSRKGQSERSRIR